jgi:hypothetical protein
MELAPLGNLINGDCQVGMDGHRSFLQPLQSLLVRSTHKTQGPMMKPTSSPTDDALLSILEAEIAMMRSSLAFGDHHYAASDSASIFDILSEALDIANEIDDYIEQERHAMLPTASRPHQNARDCRKAPQ